MRHLFRIKYYGVFLFSRLPLPYGRILLLKTFVIIFTPDGDYIVQGQGQISIISSHMIPEIYEIAINNCFEVIGK